MDVRTPQRAILALLVMLALLPAASALAADTGTAGPAFTGATAPTGEKPQSKQWFNDGSWWAVMYRPSAGSYQIFRDVAGTWTPTGTDVDTRESTYADAQWDGAHLNIVSAGMGVTQGVRYMRFSYDPATQAYTRDFAPVTLTSFGVEAAVLDRDGAGTLWITYTHDQQVWVAHSTTDDESWSTPFVLPASATVTADDISAIVRYPGHIGVMYSNQDPAVWEFAWASHADGAADTDWQLSTALQGAELSDDHINLKALDNDPAGQVFAAVKTSLNTASDPQIKLLVLDNAGAWHDYNVWTVGDEPTRAQVMLDPLRRAVHVFASHGPCPPCTGGTVSVKTADLDNIAFAPGIGTVLMQSATDQHINNVTLTKQPISTAMSFLPVLAGDDSTDSYWFNALDLPALSSPPATQPGPAKPPASKPSTSAPAGDTATATASATPLPSDASAPQVAILRLPRVTRLGVMPAAFRRRGTVAFWLSRATPAVVRLERRTPAGRYLLARRYVRKGHKGANALHVNAHGLRPGTYRALVGVPGRKAVVVAFRIGR